MAISGGGRAAGVGGAAVCSRSRSSRVVVLGDAIGREVCGIEGVAAADERDERGE